MVREQYRASDKKWVRAKLFPGKWKITMVIINDIKVVSVLQQVSAKLFMENFVLRDFAAGCREVGRTNGLAIPTNLLHCFGQFHHDFGPAQLFRFLDRATE